MRIPNSDHAVIPVEKLRDYLLSPNHPIGRFKATFFAGLGYTADGWAILEADLRSQHLPLDAEESDRSAYGRKFVITGRLTGPAGTSANLISVWVIHNGEESPRFVTAYPGASR